VLIGVFALASRAARRRSARRPLRSLLAVPAGIWRGPGRLLVGCGQVV